VVQSEGVVTMQELKFAPDEIGRQHAPWGGCGHWAGAQAVVVCSVPLCEAHSAAVKIEHATVFCTG